MPPFRLEFPDRLLPYQRSQRIIYTKNEYSEGVKVQDWQGVLSHKPIDIDPLSTGKVNHFLSHYNRLGQWQGNGFTTTTQNAFEQIFVPEKPNPQKYMFNYYTYNDNDECQEQNKAPQEFCPQICAADYLTTMKNSYQLPYPYTMQRVAAPIIPFMRNRKCKTGQSYLSNCKFFDESFEAESREIQKYKGNR